jgi:phosphopantothenoylcysteine decarboxylase
MAKMAHGLSDNLLMSIFRCWDFKNIQTRPVIVAPAMNTYMYENPITE